MLDSLNIHLPMKETIGLPREPGKLCMKWTSMAELRRGCSITKGLMVSLSYLFCNFVLMCKLKVELDAIYLSGNVVRILLIGRDNLSSSLSYYLQGKSFHYHLILKDWIEGFISVVLERSFC